jgi:hypothetical protein
MTTNGYDFYDESSEIDLPIAEEEIEEIGLPSDEQFIGRLIAIIPDYIYPVGAELGTDYTFNWTNPATTGTNLYFDPPEGFPFMDLTEVFEVGDEIVFTYSDITQIETLVTYYIITVDTSVIEISETLGGEAITLSSEESQYAESHLVIGGDDPTPIKNNIGIAAIQIDPIWSGAGYCVGADYSGRSGELRTFPLDTGGLIIQCDGIALDFAPDLAQPTPVASWRVNKDIFNFNDNDDKRKLATKVTVRGKDIQGQSISVSLAAYRTYDTNRKFFNCSTFVSRKSEGYIYKNNFAGPDKTIDTINSSIEEPFTTDYGGNSTKIYIATGLSSYAVGSPVYFIKNDQGDLPTGIISSGTAGYPGTQNNITYYYVVSNVAGSPGYVELSPALGGTAMDIGSDSSGFASYIENCGNFVIDNADSYLEKGQAVILSGVTMPAGISAGVYYVANDCTTSATQSVVLSKNPNGIPVVSIGSGGSTLKMNSIPLSGLSDLGLSPVVLLHGWGYAIPTGSEVYCSIPGGVVSPFITTGNPVEEVDSNGVMYTKIFLTSWTQQDFSGRGYLLNRRLYVNDLSQVVPFLGNTLRVGEELIDIQVENCGTDPQYGGYIYCYYPLTRTTSASNKCYPHGVGAMVSRWDSNPEYPYYYDSQYPEPESPIAVHGERISDITVDSNITYGYLDAYATALLLGNGVLFKKATCSSPIPKCMIKRVGWAKGDNTLPTEYGVGMNRLTFPRVGDMVEIYDNFTDTSPTEWSIMSVTINCDKGTVDMILGDYEMNPVTSMIKATNGINRPTS